MIKKEEFELFKSTLLELFDNNAISVTALQRKLEWGYPKGAYVMDKLAEKGIVSEPIEYKRTFKVGREDLIKFLEELKPDEI